MVRIRYKTKKSVFEYRGIQKQDAVAKVQEHAAQWSDVAPLSDLIAEWVDDADDKLVEPILFPTV